MEMVLGCCYSGSISFTSRLLFIFNNYVEFGYDVVASTVVARAAKTNVAFDNAIQY